MELQSALAVMKWDVFISYASEDGDAVARPLAALLRAEGLRVWLDENELQVGDSVRAGLDAALSSCRFVAPVLSETYFEKAWTRRELDACTARESDNSVVILPVRHGLRAEDLVKLSPMLGSRV